MTTPLLSYEEQIPILSLERTPKILFAMLWDQCEKIALSNEGAGTWSPKEVVAHLLFMDKFNWIERVKVLVNNKEILNKFDLKKQFEGIAHKNLNQLLQEFEKTRSENLEYLKSVCLKNNPLHSFNGVHPDYGKINLQELLSTWVAHDLTHIHQISRVMAKSFKETIVLSLLE